MITSDLEKLYPSAKTLVKECVASRLHAKDATLFNFSEEAATCAQNFMGWTTLATNPPLALNEIKKFADDAVARGIETVVLVGQGGSTQAPMTITKYNKEDQNRVSFKTLDSDSPVRMREFLAGANLAKTLVIVSSKSGSTIEPRLLLSALHDAFLQEMPQEEAVKHVICITDPGSKLEEQARKEGWAAIFSGEPSVGGRFSALSVFGLLPAALAGIDIEAFMEHARTAENLCSEDSIDNPAVCLAAFLFDNYQAGRDKFAFLSPKRGRVLGLWVEQLVAESLGKGGQGILPNIEVDSLLLSHDPTDRSAVVYQTKTDLWDERKNFELSLAYIDSVIPRMNFRIDTVEELAEHFVMWEYAVSMCGYLMKLCPFDQPDVASAKAAVLNILNTSQPTPNFSQSTLGTMSPGETEVRVSSCFEACKSVHEALYELLSSIKPGDYFALNAFLPFTGEGRREALEAIRHGVAENLNVPACLEIGPRYLHSTGQLHKGGPNTGVFLIISADELKDIPLKQEAESLGALAKAQAIGDLLTLAERDRRCVHLHLPDNSGVTLRILAAEVARVLEELKVDSGVAAGAGADLGASADADTSVGESAGTGAADVSTGVVSA